MVMFTLLSQILPTGRVYTGTSIPNGFSNIDVIDAEVSDESGTITFATIAEPGVHHVASDHEADDAVLISVPFVSLDDFIYIQCKAPPSFLKIDVEGTDLDILKGDGRR